MGDDHLRALEKAAQVVLDLIHQGREIGRDDALVEAGFGAQDLRVAVEDTGAPDDQLPAEVVQLRDRLREVNYEEAQAALKYSIAGRIGSGIELVSRYAGFDWRTNVALLSGFAAKELIIATLGTAYSLGEAKRGQDIPLGARLSADPRWDPLKAFALIVFIMLYAPCIATVVCIVRESGTWKWGLFSMVFNTAIAFALALAVFQGGRWMGI